MHLLMGKLMDGQFGMMLYIFLLDFLLTIKEMEIAIIWIITFRLMNN